MKVWCGNRTVTRKSSIEGLYICEVALDILKSEQISLFYSDSYFNLGGLELCFGGAIPAKSTPVVTGLCSKTSACFLMQLTRKSTYVT